MPFTSIRQIVFGAPCTTRLEAAELSLSFQLSFRLNCKMFGFSELLGLWNWNKWDHSINSHLRYILGYVKIILYAIGNRDGYKSYEDLCYIYSEWNSEMVCTMCRLLKIRWSVVVYARGYQKCVDSFPFFACSRQPTALALQSLSPFLVLAAWHLWRLGRCLISTTGNLTSETERRMRTAHSDMKICLSALANAGVNTKSQNISTKEKSTTRVGSKHI